MFEIKIHRDHARLSRILVGVATLICLCTSIAAGKQVHGEPGKVDGAVVVRDVQGNPSTVPHAKVTLRGPANIETETDEDGNFSIASIGGGVFNLFNHFNPRDVQNNLASPRFGGFFNSAWREYRGKFVLEF